MSKIEKHKVVIVGTGFSGICSAIKLKKAGITDFVLLEKNDEMGGTWYVNTYPGAAVDVLSYLYCFSFEPYNWSRKYAFKKEILEYTNYVIDKHKLREKSRLNSNVIKQEYNDSTHKWTISIENGDSYEADYLINAWGGLSSPSFANIKGREKFKGESCHSAEWDKNISFKGKRVAIIGSAASAVQIVPEAAKEASKVEVFQRTPNWFQPRKDREFKPWERFFLNIRPIGLLYRESIYWKNETRVLGFVFNPKLLKKYAEPTSIFHIRNQIKDPELQKKVIPNYTQGCKRVLMTDDFYPALTQPNVELHTEGVSEVKENSLITSSGKEIDADVIIYCTGFKVHQYNPYEIVGSKGITATESFKKEGYHGYMGTFLHGFPKMFITLGPNTSIGHTSALHILESQMNIFVKTILTAEKKKWKSFDINAKVEKDFNDLMKRKMSNSVWVKGGCESWYLDEHKENRLSYPDFTYKFRSKAKSFDLSKLDVIK